MIECGCSATRPNCSGAAKPTPWTAEHLIYAPTKQPSTLFAELELIPREKGFGDVLDEWDDLSLLRC